jgi:Fatty acid hydroxylase superfamily
MNAASRPVRTGFADALHEFWRHPSPWAIGTTLVIAAAARIALGDWQITDALVPVVMVALFPFFEWVIHVCVLHWRPRRVAGRRIDPLLARKHREHHLDPRAVHLIFIPWQSLLWVVPIAVATALLAFPGLRLGLTYLVAIMALGLCYEWCHYLIHTDYKPKSAAYRAIWRKHRLHHYKNEHYWFTVTSAGTADRVLGTYPAAATVRTSATAKNLHAGVEAA